MFRSQKKKIQNGFRATPKTYGQMIARQGKKKRKRPKK